MKSIKIGAWIKFTDDGGGINYRGNHIRVGVEYRIEELCTDSPYENTYYLYDSHLNVYKVALGDCERSYSYWDYLNYSDESGSMSEKKHSEPLYQIY